MNKELIICAIKNNLDDMFIGSWGSDEKSLENNSLKAAKVHRYKNITVPQEYKTFWGRTKQEQIVKTRIDGFKYYVEFKKYRCDITEDEFNQLIESKKQFDLDQSELELKKLCNERRIKK
jgi:hypothetical protein